MLTFETKLKEIPVVIDGKNYTIKELNGELQEEYTDSMSGRMQFNDEGKMTGMTSYKGLRTGLIAACLYDDNGALVSEDILKKWPSSVLQSLFDAASELSGLNQGADVQAKND